MNARNVEKSIVVNERNIRETSSEGVRYIHAPLLRQQYDKSLSIGDSVRVVANKSHPQTGKSYKDAIGKIVETRKNRWISEFRVSLNSNGLSLWYTGIELSRIAGGTSAHRKNS